MGSLEQAVYAIIISFVIGVILCPIVIPMLRKLKFGQNVRDDGPQTHLAKQGTPTMGGVAFLAAFVITSLFFRSPAGRFRRTTPTSDYIRTGGLR